MVLAPRPLQKQPGALNALRHMRGECVIDKIRMTKLVQFRDVRVPISQRIDPGDDGPVVVGVHVAGVPPGGSGDQSSPAQTEELLVADLGDCRELKFWIVTSLFPRRPRIRPTHPAWWLCPW